MRNLTDNLVNTISKETFKKLFLLHIIGEFQRGVFGKKRLHKIVYIIERDFDLKPFEFKRYYYGQYSESLDDIQDQLLSMGYLVATPLEPTDPEHSGNRFELADRRLSAYYSLFIENIHPRIKQKIRKIIGKYGYMKESELIEIAYQFPEFIHAQEESVILPEQLPDFLELKGLDVDDIEELEISLNPRFISLLNKVDNAFEQNEFDPQKVRKVVELL